MKLLKPIQIFLLLVFYLFSHSQISNIKIDSGKLNKIKLEQMGKDSSQKSVINLAKSDSNQIELKQSSIDTLKIEKPSVIDNLTGDTNKVVTTLAAIGSLILIVLGIVYFKKKKD